MFGYVNKCYDKETRVCTPELLAQALDSPQVAKTCAEIEDLLEDYRRGKHSKEEFENLKGAKKKELPALTPHATFDGKSRTDANAIPSGLSIYDLDNIPNPRAKWAEIEARKQELGILMAHVTPSTMGLRLIFIIPRSFSLAQAQAWMARQLGDTKYDEKVKDYARCSFLVPRDYVLYLDEEGLFAERLPTVEREEDNHLPSREGAGGVSSDHLPSREGSHPEGNYPDTYDDIPYSLIVEVLEEQMGGRPEHGNRNTFIFSMACHLRYVCDDDPSWIARILPNYGEGRKKWFGSIKSACNRSQTPKMPRIMKRTLDICRTRMHLSEGVDEEQLPPPMPRKLPPLIKLLISRTPKVYQAAVAHAVFPSLGAHLWQTNFRYIDNVCHEATLMNVLIAGTGAGKNCITEPINRILADIRRRDAENLLREKEWKREISSKGANKDKRQRPEGLVIQEIDSDMTNAAFVQRLADAEGRFLYTKMNELDQFDALKTSAKSKNHFQIMCLAFDPGNVYGQTRVGTGSVSERVCIRFNWNASTTIHKGKAYFRSVLTDGPISRINFCTIEERPIGSEMPVYGTYDAAFDEELRPYIDRLNKACGSIECRQARALSKKLVEECADFARLSESRVYENLSYRANVIAFLKACILYVAHGEKWDKTMEDFIRWSLAYDMWCKMHFFGQAIEDQECGSEVKSVRPGPRNLLDLLPEVFTREEAGQLRTRQGIRHGTLKAMISNWKKRGYIEVYGDVLPQKEVARQRYIKTESYLKDHPQS